MISNIDLCNAWTMSDSVTESICRNGIFAQKPIEYFNYIPLEEKNEYEINRADWF